MSMRGYLRSDGRKGIRNVVAVAYLVECAHHVSRLIVQKSGADDVHLIGFPGCYPNKYSLEMMQRLLLSEQQAGDRRAAAAFDRGKAVGGSGGVAAPSRAPAHAK